MSHLAVDAAAEASRRISTIAHLTQADVERLIADPSADSRADAAERVARQFSTETLSDAERVLATEIFRLMVRDAEVRVREALALNLKENPSVPHDVALALANDEETVAVPVLATSAVLTDSDLIAIISSRGAAQRLAIAGRQQVSAAVSEAIVDTGDEPALTRLVANEGADLSEGLLTRVTDEFGNREGVQNALVGRSSLPVTIAERLVAQVSDVLRDELLRRHELSPAVAADLLFQARERATVKLSGESDAADVEQMVRQLHQNGRLTPSIVLRAACMGDMTFFEAALAELAEVPLLNAQVLIHDSGTLGLRAIFEKAGLPEALYPGIRAAVDVARETDYDGGDHDRERYARRMIERILTQYDDLGVALEVDDLEYLLAKMSQLAHDEQNAAKQSSSVAG